MRGGHQARRGLQPNCRGSVVGRYVVQIRIGAHIKDELGSVSVLFNKGEESE